LNGSLSDDPEDGPLTYAWSFASVPEGSAAALSDPAAAEPTFVADVAGNYVVQLIVTDNAAASSAPATVTITVATGNQAPLAQAGADQALAAGETVTLDGSLSGDPEAAPLSYAWSLTSTPEGSAAALSDPAAAEPTFVADVAGEYVAQLIVNDGTLDSAPDTVVITAQDVPAGDVDLDIVRFKATRKVKVNKPVKFRLKVRNVGQADGDTLATLVGTQNGEEVHRQSARVAAAAGTHAKVRFERYRPTAEGEIVWTVTLDDAHPADNSATAVTAVKAKRRHHERDEDDRDEDDEDDRREPGRDRDRHERDDD
jgi:hypothetical protein